MGRIFKTGNEYRIISRSGVEKVAFVSNFEGEDLRNAINGYAIHTNLEGWDNAQILEDLEDGGLIPPPPPPPPPSDFYIIESTKGSVTWKHRASGKTKQFSSRTMGHNSSEWSDDQWNGRSEGGFTGVQYLDCSREAAEDDYKNNPESWK